MNGRKRPARAWGYALLATIVLVSVLRVVHLGFPLERDEGEFGYIAQEMLRGVPIYESAHTQKLPGTYLFYALFIAILGHTAAAIHIGLLLVNAACMTLVFLVLRKTHEAQAGWIGSLVFGVMALSPTVFGFAAHATFFVALFALGGLYALLLARERDRAGLFVVSGLGFGLATLMKQPGLFFAPLAVLLLAVDQLAAKPRQPARFARQALALSAGAVTPLLVTAAYYAAIGKFSLLWFWAFEFAGAFTQQVGGAEALENVRQQTLAVMAGFEILWALAAVGLVATLFDTARAKHRYLYASFGVAGVLSVVPGFHFTNHYYITLLPAVALLIGALAGSAGRGRPRVGPRFFTVAGTWVLIGLGLLVALARHEGFYYGQVPDDLISRRIYGANPFPESVPIAEYLKRHTTPEDRIAILGSETQILFYAKRRSATRFVNTYYLTAQHSRNREMQQEMIQEIEQAKPAYIVFVSAATSWSFQPDSPRDIVEWFNAYHVGRYQVEGMCEVLEARSVLKWGEEARAYQRTSDSYLAILRRLESQR